MSTEPTYSSAAALRQPVDLESLDFEATVRHASKAARIAAEVINGKSRAKVTADAFERLCGAATAMVLSGEARDGIKLNELRIAADVGAGRIRSRFTPSYEQAGALAVRLMQYELTYPVHYDIILGQLADTRAAQSLGAFEGGVRHLMYAGVSANTSCIDRLFPLVTGTRHDRNHSEADRAAIARFQDQLRVDEPDAVLPATVCEHIERLVKPHEQLRDLIRRSGKALDQRGFNQRVVIEQLFPEVLVIPTISTGERLPGRDAGEPYYAGRDEQLRLYVAKLGRPAMLSLGPLELDPETVDDQFPRSEAVYSGWTGQLGLAAIEFGVEYRINRHLTGAKSIFLVRTVRQKDADGNVGVDCEGWALINFPVHRRGQAVEIAEHLKRERWPDVCHKEFRNRTEPGLLQGKDLRPRLGIHTSACVGNGACVTLDRLERQQAL